MLDYALQLQSTSEIRTFGFQSALKSKQRLVRTSLFGFRFVRFVRTFGFQTLYIKIPKMSEIRTFEQHRSDFRHKFVSEIRTNLFGFQTDLEPNRNCNRTYSLCLKSKHVRISDVYCRSNLINFFDINQLFQYKLFFNINQLFWSFDQLFVILIDFFNHLINFFDL